MDTIFQAATRYRSIPRPSTFYIPNCSCPQLYPAQQSRMFPWLEWTQTRRINSQWFDALAFVHIYMSERNNIMGNKNKKAQSRPEGMPEMVNRRLTDDELTAFDQWLGKNMKEFSQMYVDVLVNQIKIGMSIDAQNSCFICSFTPKGEKDENLGKCLISRSDEWQEAFMMNVYKQQLFAETNDGEWIDLNNNRTRG